MKKIALIFGVTGQDGAYLSEFLLKKNVEKIKKRMARSGEGANPISQHM
jgi:GDPmannose 4,6-dehydratase